MTRLERSEVLQRKIRKDDVTELGIPDWDLVSEAIKAGRTGEAIDFLEYTRDQSQRNTDSLVSSVDIVLTRLASFGEEEVEKIFRYRYTPRVKNFLSITQGVKEALRMGTEMHRRHHSNCVFTEEPNRYVVKCDPCGSGGRLRRTRTLASTKKAYPWSWGKAGVPYYCCHCCLAWEILPTELRGYPVKVILIGDKPEDPCVHLFYKKPELIPEEYFARIGMKKDMAKLKR